MIIVAGKSPVRPTSMAYSATNVCFDLHGQSQSVSRRQWFSGIKLFTNCANERHKKAVLLTLSMEGKALFGSLVPPVQSWEDPYLQRLFAHEISH